MKYKKIQLKADWNEMSYLSNISEPVIGKKKRFLLSGVSNRMVRFDHSRPLQCKEIVITHTRLNKNQKTL